MPVLLGVGWGTLVTGLVNNSYRMREDSISFVGKLFYWKFSPSKEFYAYTRRICRPNISKISCRQMLVGIVLVYQELCVSDLV